MKIQLGGKFIGYILKWYSVCRMRINRRRQLFFLKIGLIISVFTNCAILVLHLYREGYFDHNHFEGDIQRPILRPEKCDKCFKHKFKYILNNAKLCESNDGIDLLFLIFTQATHVKQRALIRRTWISLLKKEKKVKYSFLLGKSTKKQENQKLIEEHKKHRDIIQENFADNYSNLTYKTMMAFKWASANCADARFVFKVDDDTFVNIKAILQSVLTKYGEKLQSAVGGFCSTQAKPHRNKHSKYYIPYSLYPDEYYPPFCSGPGYLTSMNVVKKVYLKSKNIPLFPLEDVYVGICLRILGYTTINIKGFNVDRVIINPCVKNVRHVFTSHGNSIMEVDNIWNIPCNNENYLKNYYNNNQTTKSIYNRYTN